MTKTEFLHYARNKMRGWCYVWIDRGEDGAALHELYRFGDRLSWTENPVTLVGQKEWLLKAMQETAQMLKDRLIFTEQELSNKPS